MQSLADANRAVAPSRASELRATEEGARALQTLSFTLVAANESLRGLVRLIGRHDVGVPQAAVARATLEALARAWWPMSARDNQELSERVQLLVAQEAMNAARDGKPEILGRLKAGGESVVISKEEYDGEMQAELVQAQLTLKGRSVPSYSDLAVSLLERTPVLNPRHVYSDLSGLAHGESLFISRLALNGKNAGSKTFMQTLSDQVFYGQVLTSSAQLCVGAWLTICGENALAARWVQHCGATLEELHKLRSSLS